MSGKFITLCDSAFGSSGKGCVSARLAQLLNINIVSSCNYPNAGHTVSLNSNKFIFKALPSPTCLKPWFGQEMKAYIGPNSGFDYDQIIKEITWSRVNPIIHPRAIFVSQRHQVMEAMNGMQSTAHLASTMSGSGAAMVEKAMRQLSAEFVGYRLNAAAHGDFYKSVYADLKSGKDILHEVSQGFALSLNHGLDPVCCTSRDCTPQQAYADFCITKKQIGDVYLNLRTFPIRVGSILGAKEGELGYSGGGYPDQEETDWTAVGCAAGMPQEEIDALFGNEKTTVTKRLRRVFTFSWQLLDISARLTGATKIIINFPQYIDWTANKIRGNGFCLLPDKVRKFIDKVESVTNLPVVMVGTGADHFDFVVHPDYFYHPYEPR